MSRWLKISLKVLVAIILLICIVWVAAAYYINKNNEAILAKILTKVNSSISGTIKVSHMEPNLISGFPGIAIALKNVELKDSLFDTHKHELLKANSISVSLNALSLLIGTVNIRKIGINDAKLYLYTDSTGYTNSSLFRKKKPVKDNNAGDKESSLQVRLIDFNKVDIVIDNQYKSKLFSFFVTSLTGKIKYPMGKWTGEFKLNTLVRDLAFNTKKGSFLKDKNVNGRLSASYDDESETIIVEQKPLLIGADKFAIGASINLAKDKSGFSIAIKADKIPYKNVAVILAPNISSKLLKFGIEKPIDVVASIIDNGDKNSKDPLINVKMTVDKNNLSIPSGMLKNCSFTGFFSNQDTTFKPIGDANSVIRFFNLKADYYNAPLTIDTFTVANLEKPIARGLVLSKFDLKRLNDAPEFDAFKFDSGTADLKLYCSGDIDNFLFTKPVIYGKINIKNATISYLPRNLKFINSSLDLNFNQKDLSINNSRFQLGKSILTMDAQIENFLNLYYTDPEKIEVKVNLASPFLNMSEFMPFLSSRKPTKKTTSTKTAIRVASKQLTDVLESAKITLQLNVKKAVCNHFLANNLVANVSLFGNSVNFNKIAVNHAGGKIDFSGKVEQAGTVNKMNINANIAGVSIKEFFYAFNNFGQTSLTHKNLKGFLSANVNAVANVTEKGNLIPKSTFGKINFSLNKAALVHFEPIEKVGKFVFRSRNLSNVEIEKVNGTLTLRGDMVDITPLKINSTAINFDVKGVYGFNKGTNIELAIPLRDPKKSATIVDKEERELARMKGIVLHLKAVEEDGKTKIKWNGDRDKKK